LQFTQKVESAVGNLRTKHCYLCVHLTLLRELVRLPAPHYWSSFAQQ